MKKLRIFTYAATAFIALAAISCANKEKFDEVTELSLVRCLTPMNLEAKVNANLGDVVTFSWDVAKDAQSYVLSVYTDAALSDVFFSETLEPSQVPYTVKLDADATYYFTVVAKNANKDDSKVADYGKAIKTYAVKDNLYMKLVGRTSTSVSLAWSKEVSDYEDVDRLVSRLPGDESTEESHVLTADEIANATAVVEDLVPGTEYEFILYFKSATRGQVNAWTAVSTEGMTEVSSLDGLLNGVKTQGAQLYLKLEGSPYDIEALDITNGFTLVGETDTDGNMPVLTGEMHFADTWAGQDLYFENITFDGAPTAASPSGFGFVLQNKNGGTVKGKNIGDIAFVNCVITNYTKGLMYEWGNDMVLGDVIYDSCEITNINADGTQGGDVFDIRQATTIKSLSIVNNTIVQGMRTFVRLDAGTLGALVFENNTLYNLCFIDNTNNAGVFGLQIVPGSFTFKKNLFLNMTGKATLVSANTKYKNASDLSASASDNYFWELPKGDDGKVTFFTDNFTAAQAGAIILEDSPCYNAAGGYFNILATSDIAGKGIGASKWWTPYVEEPEDLTMTLVPVPHTWNLGNAKYFTGSIKKEMVRDYLFVSGSESLPIVADGGMLNFQSAVVVNRQGVPQHNFVAFHTDQPGSLVIKAENAGDYTGHLVVGVGDAEGTSIALKGGASALAEQGNATKILITSITEESVIYVYPSGPVSLSQLSWTADVTPVNTALPAPAPKAEPASFTAGEAQDIVISWDPVDNASSYSVVFSGKTYIVEELSYTIEGKTSAMLDAGSYSVAVYANPGATDIYNSESAAGVAAFAVLPAGGGNTDEFIVASTDELLSAIEAGRDFITLKYSDTPYEVGKVTLNAPLHLKGQKSGDKVTAINASFTLSGEIGGSIVLRDLDITSTDAGSAVSVLIDDKTTAPVADTVAIYDSYLHGTKALYDNSGKATSNVQYVIFKGNVITDSSNGADFIDMRAGAHHNFVFENNTVANSCRTFVRTDAGHEMNTALIKNNTFYKVATNASSKDNNGILHIRSAAGAGLYNYAFENNFVYSILIDPEQLPSNANGFPKLKSGGGLVPNVIRNNYFFNCEETLADYSFWKNLSKEEATVQGGAILPSDPCKDAANLDFTLTNAVMMNAGVGDPRWNAMAGSTPTSEITVADADALLTAISAGKKVITLADGAYDVSTASVVLNNPLTITGSSNAVVTGKFELGTGATTFTLQGITLDGKGSLDKALDNAIYVQDGAQVQSVTLRNITVKYYANRMFYQDKEASNVNSLVIDGIQALNMGTSGDFIDVRKGGLNAVKVTNSTFANGIRTFARIDAPVVCGSILVQNNTFYNLCYVDSKDNNGIFHIRSTSATSANQIIVKDNLFASMHQAADAPSNAQGFPKLVSKTSSAIALPVFSHNYFADVLSTENNTDAEFSWWAYSAKEVALAGFGVVLTADVFNNAGAGDFTVVHDLVASEKVGDPRWIRSYAPAGEPFKVANVEDLVNALAAGKSVLSLTGTSYDLTAAEGADAGSIVLPQGVTLKGVSHNGLKPEVIGGFKLSATEGGFTLENLRLNGAYDDAGTEKKVGNMVDVDASAVLSGITLKDCEIYGYANRLISNAGESTVGEIKVTGLLVHNFGTSGDFIDIRKGNVSSVNVNNSTFWNGIRTFVRIDAAVVCGAVTVENNTFYNLCSVDSKDNNGIMHVRSSSAVVAPAPGHRAPANGARRILVKKNIFAAMHRAAETPSNAAGFPKLVSTASEKIAHPYITDNLFFDIDTTDPYNWWNTMTAEDIQEAGTVLEETPFSADPTTGKFTVKSAYKGYGDTRW